MTLSMGSASQLNLFLTNAAQAVVWHACGDLKDCATVNALHFEHSSCCHARKLDPLHSFYATLVLRQHCCKPSITMLQVHMRNHL